MHLSADLQIARRLRRDSRISMDNLNEHKGGLSKTQLHSILDYIDSHLDEALTVDELARIACLSRYHFGKMFKQSSGKTPHQYVLARRIERARDLLSRRRNSLVEIALAAGFRNQSHFTSVFSSRVGVTPAAYRRWNYAELPPGK